MYHTSFFLIFLITCKHVIIPLLKVAFFCNPHYMILPIRYVTFSTPFRILAIFFQPREELCLKGHFIKGRKVVLDLQFLWYTCMKTNLRQ